MSSGKTLLAEEAAAQRDADLKNLLRRNIDRHLVIGQVVKVDVLDRLWDELSRRDFRDKFEAAAVVASADAGASHRLHHRHGAVPHGFRVHWQAMRTPQATSGLQRVRRRRGSFE